jgi:hypothetical protein
MHLTTLGNRLDDKQIWVKCFGINISDKDKLQFYLEQMYSWNQVDQTQMTAWENKTNTIKTDWLEAKRYFEGLVPDFEAYKQNSGGTAGGKASMKVPTKLPKPTKATNSGTTSPPSQQQR